MPADDPHAPALVSDDAIAGPLQSRLERLDWDQLEGFAADDLGEALGVFRRFWLAGERATRPAQQPAETLAQACRSALAGTTLGDARAFFTANFQPWRVLPAAGGGFVTGYYEPEVDGSLTRTDAFTAPVLARPDDLVTFPTGGSLFPPGSPATDRQLTAARRLGDGSLAPYPDRAAIEAGAIADRTQPIVWLRDHVEVFLIQVQGSGRVRLQSGETLRLGYDGRNGRPYTSVGRVLVEEGHMPMAAMSLARLKAWLRQDVAAGRALMARNLSYIFFKIDASLDAAAGPVGGAGLPLTPLRSIAVDRHAWPYGLPFWISAELPWRSATPEPFRRLMIAEDTGSAILGPARADLFFGTGEAAGTRAGDIRHAAAFTVLLPAGAATSWRIPGAVGP